MKPNSAEWLKYRRDEYEAQRLEMEAENAASVPPEPPTLSDEQPGDFGVVQHVIRLVDTMHNGRRYTSIPCDDLHALVRFIKARLIDCSAYSSDVAALRAELADARAELKRWDELRRAVAECNGMDANTWPEHGNAPLAIASTVALQRLKLDQIARSASGEDDRRDEK